MIIFYYHNESIELMNYYLDNLETIFKKIKSTLKIKIIINIVFFVSYIEEFINRLSLIKKIVIDLDIEFIDIDEDVLQREKNPLKFVD